MFDRDSNGEYGLLESTIEAFGDKLVHNRAGREWTLIAKFPKHPKDGDGQDVRVYCSSLPAEFFLIEALETPNSVNELNKGFSLSTGSGQAKLIADMAQAISTGMLALA